MEKEEYLRFRERREAYAFDKEPNPSFDVKGNRLTFVFTNEKALNHFKSRLCESGEQQYWEYMEYREIEEDGNITGTNFNYHTGTSEIEVSCGRLLAELEEELKF